MNVKWNEVTRYSRWGAIILFLVIVPILSFYIGTQYELVTSYTNQLSSNQKSEKDVRGQTSTTTVTNIDTSKWKTYRSDAWGFQFKYPPDAIIDTYGQTSPNPESEDLAIEFPKNNSLGIFSNRFRLSVVNEDVFKKSLPEADFVLSLKGEKIDINGLTYYYQDNGLGFTGGKDEAIPEYWMHFQARKIKTGFSNITIQGDMEADWDSIDTTSMSQKQYQNLPKDVHAYEPNFNSEKEKNVAIQILKSLKFDY